MKKKKKKNKRFGFQNLKREVAKKPSLIRSIRRCETCKFYWSDNPDNPKEKDTCHCGDVTSFDFINDGTRCYCCFWLPSWEK